MHPRTQHALEALPPEERAAAEAAITRSAARRATPSGQAEEKEVIRKVREEFPPWRSTRSWPRRCPRCAQNASDRA